MKIGEAIAYADTLIKNNIDNSIKMLWLAELDGKIIAEQYDTRAGISPDENNKWVAHLLFSLGRSDIDGDYDDNDTLLIQPPYDGLYINYLCKGVYLALCEAERYSNEAALFEAKLSEYERYINRVCAVNSGRKIKPEG